MPGSTPVFNIPYPLAGDPVNPADFANLASAIDAAMTSVAAERAALLAKPFCQWGHFNTFAGLAPNVEQIITNDLTNYDIPSPGGFAPAVGGTNMVCVVPGVYTLQITDFNFFGFTTFTSYIAGLFVNGVRIGTDKKPVTNNTGNATISDVVVTWPLYAGDIITARWQWSGTGTVNQLFTTITAAFVCPLT